MTSYALPYEEKDNGQQCISPSALHVARGSYMNNDPAALSRTVLSDLTTGKTRLGHVVLSVGILASQERTPKQ